MHGVSFCFPCNLRKVGKEMAIFIELLLLGIGLAMDAFAVSICKGLAMRRVNKKQAVVIGLFFGGFQALMPFLGWVLGSQFENYITSVDHWIAFILLGFIGGKMMVEALKPEEAEIIEKMDQPLDMKEMFILAIATSIDALAVGITFAFLDYPIVEAITIIGVVTFIISVAGVYVGNFFGNKYKNKAEFVGGLILVLLGLRILLSHLGVLG
jgi:putative Mn2+ efflux pump MntP